MVQRLQPQSESLYGLPQPITEAALKPIISIRAPSTLDIGYSLGQVWINKTAGTVFTLSSNVAGVATWLSLGGSLTPAVTNITTGVAATSSLLAGNVWSATGTDAAITLTLTPKGAGGVRVSTGTLTVSTGDIVATLGDITATAGDIIATAGDIDAVAGDIKISTAGSGLQIAEGANARMGTATLVGGTVSILNTSITADTRIFITRLDAGAIPGALGSLIVENVVVGTSFDVSAVSPADGTTPVITDVSDINWLLIEAI